MFVCKSYYFECLIKELGRNSNTSRNTTYKPTSFDNDEILANHRSFMTSLNIPSGKESEDLPYLYWIPKLHKTPYKERYIAGSSTCQEDKNVTQETNQKLINHTHVHSRMKYNIRHDVCNVSFKDTRKIMYTSISFVLY